MPENFPSRTQASDNMAFLFHWTLTQAARKSQFAGDFMVSVVTTQRDGCFVGLSGNQQAAIAAVGPMLTQIDPVGTKKEREFEQARLEGMRKVFFARLDEYIDCQFSADKLGTQESVRISSILNYFPLTADIRHQNLTLLMAPTLKDRVARTRRASNLDVYTREKPPTDERLPRTATEQMQLDANQRMRELKEAVTQRPGQQAQNPGGAHPFKTYLDTLNPNWHCSEPKALAAAARSGQKIEGMTTFWYGSIGDAVYQRYRLNSNALLGQGAAAAGRQPRQLLLCRPCETCALNEHRIMSSVNFADLVARGGGHRIGRSFEAPARLSTTR